MLLEIERPRTLARHIAPDFHADVLNGLAGPPRAIPARWFYDSAGSAIFEEITHLPEYYPTRIETALLRRHGRDIAALVGPGRAVVEFGSGSSTKTPWLLNAVDPAAYIPIDISGDFLRESAAELSARFPGLPVLPVEADFLKPVRLPSSIDGIPRLGFFPGSTIGNLAAEPATDLLRAMRGNLGEGALLLIGMDRIKDPAILIPAYDDAAGVTARFNRNLLTRINRELDGDIPVQDFRHRALWNDNAARIEMHLEAQRDCRFTVAGQEFAMRAGETIHTENSHKYGRRDARLLLQAGGWRPFEEWTDPENMFQIILARAESAPAAP
jgi:dimethylhistidine N-methyltransferase